MAKWDEANFNWTRWLVALAVLFATAAFLSSPRLASAADNPFANEKFYVDPNSKAKQTEAQWRSEGRIADADQLKKISESPSDPRYFAEWTETGDSGGVEFQVRHWVGVYKAAGALPTIGAYAIPNRDCGSYSGGGFSSAQEYKNWIDGFARGIGDNKVVVILEPDALAGTDCLSDSMKGDRLSLLKYAVYSLKSRPNAHVYIDAGHSAWHTPQTIIDRLKQAGIERADGFTTNNANFRFTSSEVSWGKQVSAGVGGKHFVVDTSRNGAGPYEGGTHSGGCAPQFNPPSRTLGARPTAETGEALADAYFWLKQPGESDGACGSYPRAGAWVPEYALGLAQRAGTAATTTPQPPPPPAPPANVAPVAKANVYSVSEDKLLRASSVLKNDTDANGNPLTAKLVKGTTKGKLTLRANGTFTYKPRANFFGTDSFTYRAFDGQAYSNVVKVTIKVRSQSS